MHQVISIDNQLIDKCAKTISQAFFDDPLMSWLLPNTISEHSRLALITSWIRYAKIYGLAITTPECEAVGLRKLPGDLSYSYWRLFRSGMIKTPQLVNKELFQRFSDVEDYLVKQKNKLMGNTPFLYCWILGTHPNHRQQGYGSAICNYTFKKASALKVPCYLETVSDSAQKYHRRNGFKLLESCQLPGANFTIHHMMRESSI